MLQNLFLINIWYRFHMEYLFLVLTLHFTWLTKLVSEILVWVGLYFDFIVLYEIEEYTYKTIPNILPP